MITVDEIIQRVQSAYSKGAQSKDTRLSPRHIYSAAIFARSTVLRRQYDAHGYVSDWNYQTLDCIELNLCPVNPLLTKTPVLRSKHRIPTIIHGKKSLIIKGMNTLDGSISFDKTTFNNNKYAEGSKFTASKPRLYFEDGYANVTISKHLKALSLSAVFENPVEASLMPSLCQNESEDCTCISIFDLNFYLDASLSDAVVRMASQELLNGFGQMKEDKFNNNQDDTGTARLAQQQNDTEN